MERVKFMNHLQSSLTRLDIYFIYFNYILDKTIIFFFFFFESNSEAMKSLLRIFLRFTTIILYFKA